MSEHKNLLAAILAVQNEMPRIQKDKINPAFKGAKYVSLDALTETTTPVLTANGLIWSTFPCRDEQGDPALYYQLAHVPTGEKVDGTMPLMLAKNDPQGLGSALTYARRQSLTAVLNITTGEDDDGNKASGHQNQNDGRHRSRPSAAPVKDTERIASAKQRGMLNARASEAELPPSDYANLILTAAGEELRDFENQDHAQAWLNKSLDRLPARLVDPVLKQIERIKEAQGQLA